MSDCYIKLPSNFYECYKFCEDECSTLIQFHALMRQFFMFFVFLPFFLFLSFAMMFVLGLELIDMFFVFTV